MCVCVCVCAVCVLKKTDKGALPVITNQLMAQW